MALVTLALTAAWVPLGSVMVWKCWKTQPVPSTRNWAIAVAGMALAMLAQGWRAELWKTRYLALVELRQPRAFQSWHMLRSCSDNIQLVAGEINPSTCPGLSPLGGFHNRPDQISSEPIRAGRLYNFNTESLPTPTCRPRQDRIQFIPALPLQARMIGSDGFP